jgi:hypothetical protein
MMRLVTDQVTVTAEAGQPTDGERRIDAVALPYNQWAIVSGGQEVMFRPGSLPVDGRNPRVFMYHDSTKVVGSVVERIDTDEAMLASMKISRTALGDEALVLAADGVMDVSVGVNVLEYTEDKQGRMIVSSAEWTELSLVPTGAFRGAIVTDVAAQADTTPDTTEESTEPETVEETNVEPVQEPVAVEAAAVVPTAPLPAVAKKNFGMPSAGEYLAAFHIGGEVWQRVNAAAQDAMKERQTALQAAAGTGGNTNTENTPGLLPVPVLGPVFQDLNYVRPVVAAVGARAFPGSGDQKTFIRPTWSTHSSVASQGSELGTVSATSPVIASNVISKTTLAGSVTLSVQDVDFTSPAAMEIILRDLAQQYLLSSDNLAADGLVAGASASGSTWTVTANDPSTLIAAIYDAATDILSASNFLPDHIFVSPDVWKSLGGQLDADKRPVFPYAGAAGLMGVNGMGTANVTVANTFNPFGLNLVVDRNFASGTMVVARGAAIEYYEEIRGLMSREVPLSLGREFSYYGYASLFVADSDLVKTITVA